MRVAYLINQYPKVSHSFIRREIMALERMGIQVQRFALNGWKDHLSDDDDEQERRQTFYVLQGGVVGLTVALLSAVLRSPSKFFHALTLAFRMSFRSDRSLAYHMAYLAEACIVSREMKSSGTTHVHAHFATNSTEVAMLVNVLDGHTYSFTVHGTGEFDQIQSLGIREKVSRAAFVVAICSYGRSQLFRWLDYSLWSKIKLVHCGLERTFYEIDCPALPPTRRLVCVGRLCKEKGQMLLVEAAHRLSQEGVHFELVLAGDGEMRNDIQALVDRYRLQDRVRITGWISSSQVRTEILASRALVLPSFSEGLPVVIMEAMALRRPVLTTFVGGIPELVQHGANGWLFPAGSIENLTSSIRDCLAMSQPELEIMGHRAHSRIIQDHAIDTEVTKLVDLFKSAQSK